MNYIINIKITNLLEYILDPSGTVGPQIQPRNNESNNNILNGFKDSSRHTKNISNGKNKNVADKVAEEILSDENIPPPKIAPPVFLSVPPPPPPPPPNPPPSIAARHRQLRSQNGGNRTAGGKGPSVLRSQSMSTADRVQYISGPPPNFRPPPPPTLGLAATSYIPKVNNKYKWFSNLTLIINCNRK